MYRCVSNNVFHGTKDDGSLATPSLIPLTTHEETQLSVRDTTIEITRACSILSHFRTLNLIDDVYVCLFLVSFPFHPKSQQCSRSFEFNKSACRIDQVYLDKKQQDRTKTQR